MSTRRTSRFVAAVLVTAAAGLVGAAGGAPARADASCASVGVTVVVDFNQLGGGVPTVCVSDGAGELASTLFETAGQPLTQPTRQPGFVCRVAGKPADDPCVNTPPDTAYWGLWWSDGEPGSAWTYSTKGAYSLKGLAGGFVALAWDEVEGSERPSASASRPSAPTATPTPTPAPEATPAPSSGGSGGQADEGAGQAGSGAGSPSVTPTPSPGTESTAGQTATDPASPSAAAGQDEGQGKTGKKSRSGKTSAAELSESASPEVDVPEVTTTDPALAAETAPVDSGGLPTFVAPALIVLIFGGAGLAWWLRRRGAAPL